MKTLIYGHSDDCLEVDGFDEFSPPCEGYAYLHFNEGTVVKGGYDVVKGKGWDIQVVKQGTAKVTVLEPLADNCDEWQHFSDRLELDGVDSVECWRSADGPTDQDMEEWWERFEYGDYPAKKLIAAYRILTGK